VWFYAQFTTKKDHTHSIASLLWSLPESTGWCLSAAQTLSSLYKRFVNEQQSLDEL
jgi:hypothetical protein